MKSLKALILFILIALVVAGCSSAEQASPNKETEGLTIYTTLYPIQYAAERIGGDTISVESVFPPGVDAHTFEPTTRDMTTIADGDAFIYMGAGMEGFAETAAEALSSQEVEMVELGQNEELFQPSEGSAEDEHNDEAHEHHDGDEHHEDEQHDEGEHQDAHGENQDSHGHEGDDGHNHGDHNPHVWLDPVRMIEMAEMVKEELIELNPEAEQTYEENFTSLKDDLHQLDEEFVSSIGNKEDKHILVSHAAYGYWEERYGIEQISVNGLSSSSEPSQKELTQIIDLADEYDLEYMIYEQNSSNRVSEIIQEQLGMKKAQIHNVSVLTEEDIDNGEDYLSLMKQNIEVLDEVTN
ncbi:metal ABC transporter solute-binding protein, Zn/Mn family [Virgibacillus xinjiangensis]|uniref:Metal ABC transporter solute-binding protein, Zn/Mn family n=1 Tax=Virgibacillus xinjiangensis TaxID=393090 RepID=A0ABV7CTN0_9BACI